MIGDNDGFGFGALAVPDNGTAAFLDPGPDNRDAAEMIATDGAQLTDWHSAIGLAAIPNFTFALPGTLLSATLTMDLGGVQFTTYGETLLSFNGVYQPGIMNFEEADFHDTRLVQVVLSQAAIDAANLAGAFVVSLVEGDIQNGLDYIAVDFMSLDAVVPEPGVAALLGSVVLLLGVASRQRRA